MSKVSLGGIEVPVTEQRYARLRHTLGDALGQLGENLETTGGLDELVMGLGGEAYKVLAVLIPALPDQVPEWRFQGYSSPEAMDAGVYDPETDQSPTVSEIKTAFAVAAEVNGVDFLGKLKNLLDPTLLQAIVSGAIEDAVKTAGSTSESSSSQSPSGGSASTPSSPPAPTSQSLPGSLSPV